ncbi:unnamed protein product [Leptosia nina]|uniref:Smoothelin domain-containing protein n=1 Tax=Leptosia nina TaxID=320188 RepID=A0AAV1JRR0_9NEOP
MSDGDVSLIRDEDVLRRMWQQTEDFSRKKEIRAHMYRLREERLRNLYSPEPTHEPAKGCEFSSTQGHVKSFADQSFQSMKSKEVRDAGSPPKEFTYRGQDLNEFSNAGWNVESENRTADDGHTRVKTVNANIEGSYDVDGGRGQFSAADHHKRAVTEYEDGKTSLKRNEDYSNTSSREQVVRDTGKGTHFTSTSSFSSSASKFEQFSSTQRETLPYSTNDNYLASQRTYDTNKNEEFTSTKVTNTNNEQNVRNEYDHGELVSRKIDYPDDNTKVIVETRCLPDGTRVTSTRREFRAPSVQPSRTERHSQQTRSESNTFSSNQKKTQSSESTKVIDDSTESTIRDIVDSQRTKDDYDFKKTNISESNDDFSRRRYHHDVNKNENDERITHHENRNICRQEVYNIEDSDNNIRETINYKGQVKQNDKRKLNEDYSTESYVASDTQDTTHEEKSTELFKNDSMDESHTVKIGRPKSLDDIPSRQVQHDRSQQEHIRDTIKYKNMEECVQKFTKESTVQDNVKEKSVNNYQTTYESDYAQRKISSDLSPTHQAWASTLRADTPSRQSTRPPSPGGKTQSSTSSLRNSVSPDKYYKRTPSRSGSPNKSDKYSPSRTFSEKTYSSTHSSTQSVTERKSNAFTATDTESFKNKSPTRRLQSPDKSQYETPTRKSVSPEKQMRPSTTRSYTSPLRKSEPRSISSPERKTSLNERESSPTFSSPKRNQDSIKDDVITSIKSSTIITRSKEHEEDKSTSVKETLQTSETPAYQPGYMRPTASSLPKTDGSQSPTKQHDRARKSSPKHHSLSPDRKSPVSKIDQVKEDHRQFISEEYKYTNIKENITSSVIDQNVSQKDNYEQHGTKPRKSSESPNRNSLSRKRTVQETTERTSSRETQLTDDVDKNIINLTLKGKSPDTFNTHATPNKQPSREASPIKRSEHPVKLNQFDKSPTSITHNLEEEVEGSRRTSKDRSLSPTKDILKASTPTRKPSLSKETTDISRITESKDKTLERCENNDKKITSTRRSSSPKKPVNEVGEKYKQTIDFIRTEKKCDEMNAKSIKSRPKNLITPSTSPTRQSKTDDDAPSTEKSSPTSIDSGFVYYGSPRAEQQVVTDLDDQEPTKASKSPTVLHDVLQRIPSSSKIPCRTPSPEKNIPKEPLPRKSSLKKPSIDNSNLPSVPKPPTSFLISPEREIKNVLDTSQDSTDKSPNKPMKSKPPLERRETYEERCRKILGMLDTTTTTTTETKRATSRSRNSTSSGNSPNASPCRSPIQIESENVCHDKYETVDVLNMTDNTVHVREKSTEQFETLKTDVITKTNDGILVSKISSESALLEDEVPPFAVPATEEDKRKSHTMIASEDSAVKENRDVNITDIKQSQTSLVTNNIDIQNVEIVPEIKENDNRDVLDTSTKFIVSEREQQILDRVQSSLRKLSPDRKGKPVNVTSDESPEKRSGTSPAKHTISLEKPEEQILDSFKNTTTQVTSEEKSTLKKNVGHNKTTIKSQIPSKPSSRNVSPVKKPPGSPTMSKYTADGGKPRSVSPKKPITSTDKKPNSPVERPQSPNVPKPTAGKIKEVASQYQRTSSLSSMKTDKTITTDVKKTISNKQQSMSRLSPTKTPSSKILSNNKSNDGDIKRQSAPKGTQKDTPHLQKKEETKVTRTSSDIGLKPSSKKVSPQRMKSKPEIQVNSVTTKVSKQGTTRHQKSESSAKLPVTKPKSATALNTPLDDDDIIIDVQQAKSSRENSPDRICPTPVGFSEDMGVPRFPDEVKEPDDEYKRRTHHVIHETASDDIVEISEEDELFAKRTESVQNMHTNEDIQISVNGKVTEYMKGPDIKPKDTTTNLRNTVSKVRSNLVDDILKTDECLLSVSEKVNKFAKGPVGSKDRSPSRNITEEYDRDTIYTDDYTKLSVNDKAHLFIETAENVKCTKPKSAQKPQRPDLTNVEDYLKSDECLLSVSDKVNKFVKTAEQVLSDTYTVEEKEMKIKEQHDQMMRLIIENGDGQRDATIEQKPVKHEPTTEYVKTPQHNAPQETHDHTKKATSKLPNKPAPVKITTQRSSEAVKKAKALFENIASTNNTKETSQTKSTKLTDIGVSMKMKKSTSDTKESKETQPITQQTVYDDISQLREKSPENYLKTKTPTTREKSPVKRTMSPVVRDKSPAKRPISPIAKEKTPSNRTLSPTAREKSPAAKPMAPITREKSPIARTRSPLVREETPISKTRSPVPQTATVTSNKKVLCRFPVTEQINSTKAGPVEDKNDKAVEKAVPGYQRSTKTSQMKEDKCTEEIEVSSRRGSGKFGVELRRTSADRSSVSSERRRSSVDHHQPCIEDIFDLGLLEQMLEKVVGYEQRRRIRSQIRVAKKKIETEEITKLTRSKQTTTNMSKTKSPERLQQRSPDRLLKIQKPHSPERQPKATPDATSAPDPLTKSHLTNPEPKELPKTKAARPFDKSPERHSKATPGSGLRTSPEKKVRPVSPTKTTTPKPKESRFSEYASAYMKKVGLNEGDKLKRVAVKTKKPPVVDEARTKKVEANRIVETHRIKTFTDRYSSKDIIEVVQINDQRTPSPDRSRDGTDGGETSQPLRRQSPERTPVSDRKPSPERRSERQSDSQRSPSPGVKKVLKKETTIKTAFDIEKKIPHKPAQDEKPSWVTNRQLKKVTSESRTFSSKKIEAEKPKYRTSSPSKAITEPIDVITSSYGPGPLDADGRPLFGIRALRNGASNYQVKGTVVRQDFHSRNGGEPEGTVSVTAYSTEPEDLEKLLQSQGEKPSRLHGLAAITTTKKFGGDSGTTLSEISTREERAALDRFTHSDRRVSESKVERHTDSFDGEKNGIERTTFTGTYRREKPKQRDETRSDSAKRDVRSHKETRTDRMQKTERRVEDRKTVRQSSVKSLTEKFIKNANETSKTERAVYPKAGLILRTAGMKDSVSSDSSAHGGLARTDSEHSLNSVEDAVTTTNTTTERVGDAVRTTVTTTKSGSRMQERSFLDSSTKVTGVQDILTRMKNADIVIEEGDSNEDTEARALLNKFLGATVLMAGMQNYVTEKPTGHCVLRQETIKSQSSGGKVTSSKLVQEIDIEQCWDERVLRKLLDECTDYELRRRLRARIRALMAEQEACASAVTEALAAAGETTADAEEQHQSGERGESLLLPLLQGLLRGGGEKLLAGLGTASHGVVADVRRSLQRLRLALAPPADHPQARALLALADRLEDALDAADRLDGCKRKTRRRSRTARHTVGVTREELEEARRTVDRDALLEPVDADVTATTVGSETPERTQSCDYYDPVETRRKPAPIAHSASYETAPIVNRDARVVERRAPAPRRPDFFRHSMADGLKPEPSRNTAERLRSDSKSGIAAIANKFDIKIEQEKPVAAKRVPTNGPRMQAKPAEEPKRSSYRPPPPTYNFAAPPADDASKSPDRPNGVSKRLRMKRANTIDIGRSFGAYQFDRDTDEEANVPRAPAVPAFRPQTENDKKFLAFMKKNEEQDRNTGSVQANWSNRFGNIKNAFENREREENDRSSSASSAKRFWQSADSSQVSVTRPRRFPNETVPDVVRPPWASQRRDSLKTHVPPIAKQVPQQTVSPPVLLSPMKPANIKPFVAKPIPVNQFSHAPMSAFKPPQKILSPTGAPPIVWSPPSSGIPVSPSVDPPKPSVPSTRIPLPPGDPVKLVPEERNRTMIDRVPFERNKFNHSPAPACEYHPPTPPTHARSDHNFPIQPIPSQNNLAAPELVKKIYGTNGFVDGHDDAPKIDARQLQIEFYERQIREKCRRDAPTERRVNPVHKPPAPLGPQGAPPYTIVDYTPPLSTSTFVPLQQTPDIEKARAHKVDYLPDVVINDNGNSTDLTSSRSSLNDPVSPTKPKPRRIAASDRDGSLNGDDAATEHGSVLTKVMRGPVRGNATITAGVRTRGAADSLRGVLDKLSSPKREVIAQIEKKKRENARNQMHLAPPSELSPSYGFERHGSSGSRSPGLAASRESVFSSESPASRGSSPGSAIARSGSWHRLAECGPKAMPPRKVVARTKSMHLLAAPKLYEGGISQDEVLEKRRTVEAYFSGQTSPNRAQQTSQPRSRAQTQFALGRSRTMPSVSQMQFLDESNADDAFEDLVSGMA